jgi:dolichol-phosphate mannosyltransferase
MVELWRQGFPVVEAVKRDRGDARPGGKWSAALFYALFRRLAGLDLLAHSDFKLLDCAVVERLRALPERRRFFRGLVAWMGYPSATLPFDVPPRAGGETSWGTWRLVRYAVDNLTGFSALPLALVGWLGAIMLLVGGVAGAVALYQKFAGIALDGFTTVIVLLALASGALMLSLGVIGLYLARIYEELKGRPLYLLREEPRPEERKP